MFLQSLLLKKKKSNNQTLVLILFNTKIVFSKHAGFFLVIFSQVFPILLSPVLQSEEFFKKMIHLFLSSTASAVL